MRIIHTSDWHIGRSLFDYSLLEDQRYFFEQLFQIVKEQKADAVMVSGDLFDRAAPSSEAVALLDYVFNTLIHDCHVPVLAIAGNHDSPRRVDYGHTLFEACGLYLEGSVHKTIKKVTLQDQYGPVNFFLLPYFVPQEIRLLLEDSSISGFSPAFARLMEENQQQWDNDQRNILIAHGFFMKNNSAPVLSQSERSVGPSELTDLTPAEPFDYVALGHLHGAQSAGMPNARYSGSPLKYSVSEASQKKQVLVVDIAEKGSCSVTPIPIKPLHDLVVLTGTMDELLDAEGPFQKHKEDFIYAQLTDDSVVLHAMNRLRAVYPNILGLTFQCTEAGSQQDISTYEAQDEPLEQLFLRFYKSIRGEDASAAHEAIIHDLSAHMEKEEQ